jgi:hypothetical protein
VAANKADVFRLVGFQIDLLDEMLDNVNLECVIVK